MAKEHELDDLDHMPPSPPIPEGIEVEVVMLTPELATEWLSHNTRNRNVAADNKNALVRAIKSGEFMLTGESIKFDWDGRLIDGQHRCLAVVAAGRAVPVVVVRGLDPDAQYVIDTGKRRNASEALQFAGYQNTFALAGAARIAILWGEGRLRVTTSSGEWNRRVSNVEIVEWVEKNPDIHESVSIGIRTSRSSPLVPSVAGFAAFRLRQIDVDETASFFDDIAQMRTTGVGDPIQTLLKRYQAAKDRREKLNVPQHLFFIFRAWNARRRGEPLFNLRVGSVGTRSGETSPIEVPNPE